MRTTLVTWALALLACAATQAPAAAQAQAPPQAATVGDRPDSAAASPVEPGLADRRRRWKRPPSQQAAMVPAHILRFPFRVANYPLEHFVIHREPGFVTVYGRQFVTALGRQGIELQVRGMGAGSSAGMNVAYAPPRRLSAGKPLQLSALTTLTGYDQFALTLDSLGMGGVTGGLRLQYSERPREDFFGLGPRSALDDRTTYQLDEWQAQFTGSVPIWRSLRLATVVGVSRFDVGRGRDADFPTALEVFSRDIDGLQGRFELFEWGTGLVLDSRDDRTYARRGSVLSARVQFGDGLRDTPHAYTKYELEAQQFVPLWGERRSLAARVRAVVTDNRSGVDGVDVPVFRLERIGGSRTIRGYRSFRFADKDALIGNFEYRFPIWNIEPTNRQALDGAVLFDFGTTVPDLARLQQRDLRSAAGIGLRFTTRLGLTGRYDAMWSPEGYRGHLGLRVTF